MHTVIIPTYQEHENIERAVSAVLGISTDYRVIVVDDDSTDGTKDRLDQMARLYQDRLRVIHRSPPRSFAGSYIDGFQSALADPDCESVIECDADGSHPFERIPDLVASLQHTDVVIGSRYIQGGNIAGFSKDRLVLSTAANVYLRLTTGLPVKDITAGFVAYRADFLKKIPYAKIVSNGYAFQIEMKWICASAGGQMSELPITFIDRSKGKSKMSFHTMIEAFQFGLHFCVKRLCS